MTRAPSRAGHKGRADEVRYLLAKGAVTDLVDAGGHKPIDLVGAGGAPSAATSSNVAVMSPPPARAGKRRFGKRFGDAQAA